MPLGPQEQEFIWGLLLPWLRGVEKPLVTSQINRMFDDDLVIPAQLEALILSLGPDRNSCDIASVAAWVIKKFALDSDRHLTLLAHLYVASKLSVEEALELIPSAGAVREALPDYLRHVIDIAWLIRQDQALPVMRKGDNSLLDQALRTVVQQSFGREP